MYFRSGARAILVLCCCITLILPGMALPSDLMVITEEYPPLNYQENGTLKGISADLTEAAISRIDPAFNRSMIRVLPWSQGYQLTRERNNTILFSTGRIPEREDLFLWAGPIVTDHKVLYGLSQKAGIIY